MTQPQTADYGTLTDYRTGEPIRPATRDEWQATADVLRSDAPGRETGAWNTDTGRTVWVDGGPEMPALCACWACDRRCGNTQDECGELTPTPRGLICATCLARYACFDDDRDRIELRISQDRVRLIADVPVLRGGVWLDLGDIDMLTTALARARDDLIVLRGGMPGTAAKRTLTDKALLSDLGWARKEIQAVLDNTLADLGRTGARLNSQIGDGVAEIIAEIEDKMEGNDDND